MVALGLAVAACEGTEPAPPPAPLDAVEIAVLSDAGLPPLAYPFWITETESVFFITDRSDRDVKVYATDGVRAGTIGSAGNGVGELSMPTAAFVDGEDLVVHDFGTATVVFFSLDGVEHRRLALDTVGVGQPFKVRGVADGRFLITYHPGGFRTGRSMVHLVDRTGESLAEYPETLRFLRKRSELQWVSTVLADGNDGCVFSAVSRAKRIWIHAIDGELLGVGDLGTEADWEATAADEDARHFITQLVALPGCRAAVSVKSPPPNRTTVSIDEPVSVYVVALDGGKVSTVGAITIEAAQLVGRSRRGEPLAVQRYGPSMTGFKLIAISEEDRP